MLQASDTHTEALPIPQLLVPTGSLLFLEKSGFTSAKSKPVKQAT
jgi:hypothetical protein